MFRDLIPLLADRFRVVAPDLIGFGHSDAPPVDRFDYTFDNLAKVTRKVLDRLEVQSYVLYLHDYGSPIGFRLATSAPECVRGLVVQNANAYMEGVLVVWGKNDPFFLAAGAEAFKRDVRDAEVVLLDGGHFALEEHPQAIAGHIARVFGPRTGAQSTGE